MSKADDLFKGKLQHCPVLRKGCGFKDKKKDLCYKLKQPTTLKKADGDYRISCPSPRSRKIEQPEQGNISKLPKVY